MFLNYLILLLLIYKNYLKYKYMLCPLRSSVHACMVDEYIFYVSMIMRNVLLMTHIPIIKILILYPHVSFGK